MEKKLKSIEVIAFEVDDEYWKVIEDHMLKAGIFSRKQYFEYALALFGWSIEASRHGKVIASVDTKNNAYREVSMKPLDKARNSAEGSVSRQ